MALHYMNKTYKVPITEQWTGRSLLSSYYRIELTLSLSIPPLRQAGTAAIKNTVAEKYIL